MQIVVRRKLIFIECNVTTIYTAKLYPSLKLVVCSLQFGMVWSVKMVEFFGKSLENQLCRDF